MKKSTDNNDCPSRQNDPPEWIELLIEVHPVAHEAVSAFLFDLGCKGIVDDEKGGDSLKAYLPVTDQIEDLRSRTEIFLRSLKEFFPEATAASLGFSIIRDEDWSLAWRKHFRLERITDRLTIVPAWEPVPQASGGIVMRMDPGPAFGTGAHPTTRMCLERMEALQPPRDWTMLDVGTGSGILAIYAAKLGAGRILAVDTDPEALRWARRNIELNLCSESIDLSSKPVAELKGAFPVLVANLTREVILELLPDFRRLLERRGTMILSGLLQQQIPEVRERVVPLGFEEIRVLTQAEWACLTARRME
ncbi:MAG: 50S ribosomal protein L11 methyltransferase [Desulfobacterota bacterium]|nr:50S ribosomal protein L11 methyltransferase [Thermodesulfobacteriota bacterium]